MSETQSPPHKDDRPQYVRISDELRERIAAGRYPVGGQLPTEGDLCAEFSISRHTVREALRRLTEDGLIQRKQGSGSRVMAAEPHKNYVHAMRSLDQLFQYASDTRFIISAMKMGVPSRALIDHFYTSSEASDNTPWLVITGLRLERDEDIPICYSTVLVNNAFADIQDDLRKESGAIYRRIEDRFGVEVSEVVQDITVVPMPADAAKPLGEKAKATAVRVARRYLDVDGMVFLASVNYHPADRFSYSMQLKREGRRGNWS